MAAPVPVASDSPEEKADWLELEALCSQEQRASLEDLVRLFRREGSVDALSADEDEGDDSLDRGSVVSQQVAEDAFNELSNRLTACDGEYPFVVEQGLLRIRPEALRSPYILLLLLSFIEPTGGHGGTAVLFERLCVLAVRAYFGGDANRASAMRFGAPRRAPHVMMHQALDWLCAELGEGGGCRNARAARHHGDDGLDIVAWKHFADRREGKMVAFGQCATGANWTEKLNELDGESFAQKHFRDGRIIAPPMRLFFVPRRVPREKWENTVIDAGIIFDRCRIASCLKNLDAALVTEFEEVIDDLVDELKETQAPAPRAKRVARKEAARRKKKARRK